MPETGGMSTLGLLYTIWTGRETVLMTGETETIDAIVLAGDAAETGIINAETTLVTESDAVIEGVVHLLA